MPNIVYPSVYLSFASTFRSHLIFLCPLLQVEQGGVKGKPGGGNTSDASSSSTASSSSSSGAKGTKGKKGKKGKKEKGKGKKGSKAGGGKDAGRAPSPVGFLTKRDLVEGKNDKCTEEQWVCCDVCENWMHTVCALFNKKLNELVEGSKGQQVGPSLPLSLSPPPPHRAQRFLHLSLSLSLFNC